MKNKIRNTFKNTKKKYNNENRIKLMLNIIAAKFVSIKEKPKKFVEP